MRDDHGARAPGRAALSGTSQHAVGPGVTYTVSDRLDSCAYATPTGPRQVTRLVSGQAIAAGYAGAGGADKHIDEGAIGVQPQIPGGHPGQAPAPAARADGTGSSHVTGTPPPSHPTAGTGRTTQAVARKRAKDKAKKYARRLLSEKHP